MLIEKKGPRTKRFTRMCLRVLVKYIHLTSTKSNQREIAKALVEKIKNKEEKGINKCHPIYYCNFYKFLYDNYIHCICKEAYLNLLFLQCSNHHYHKKLVTFLYRALNNSYVELFLKWNNRALISELHKCKFFKTKTSFTYESYRFVHNILLLSTSRLCYGETFDIWCTEYPKIKLKKLHLTKWVEDRNQEGQRSTNYLDCNHWIDEHIFLDTDKRKEETCVRNRNKKYIKYDYIEIDIINKLYNCFSINNIVPFSFLNELVISNLYNFLSAPSSLIRLSGSKVHEFASILFNVHTLSQVMFHFSKNELLFLFETYLNIHSSLLFDYLYSLISLEELPETELKGKEQEQEEKQLENLTKWNYECIDSLVMSIILYCSSSNVHTNLIKKRKTLLHCFNFASLILTYLHQQITTFPSKPNDMKNASFILMSRSETYLTSVSFTRKVLLLLYVLNEIMFKLFRSKILFVNKILSIKNKLDQNIKQFTKSWNPDEKYFIFHLVSHDLLNLLYYQLFVYPESTDAYKNGEKILNRKRSYLEIDISDTVKKCIHNQYKGQEYEVITSKILYSFVFFIKKKRTYKE